MFAPSSQKNIYVQISSAYRRGDDMRKIHLLESGIVLLSFLAVVGIASAQSFSGYNYNANIFVGTYTQWCYQSGYGTNASCAASLGSSANDLVVMKWNAQWNNCNANGYNNPTYCLGAWVDNEFNGKVPGGDGSVWHYKIIWVGSEGSSSPYWLPGGYSIWNNYEVVMDQGVDPSGAYNWCGATGLVHQFCALTTPNGYGAVGS